MNKDPYDLTPVPQKDIFTYTDMTEEDFEDIVFNCFLEHAKQSFNYPEPAIDADGIFKFSRDLRAALAAANGPLQATTSKPLPVIPWSGSNLTEMEELVQKVQQLETENAEINEKLESKRKTIKSLCEELESLRIVSIENQRLTIKNKHLEEDRPQSELDAAHLAAENAMLNANFARYISATQDTEKQNERLASMVRELQDENAALKIERNRLRVVLQDIADASGFDNIGNWARNKAKNALAKEAKP